jgi:threonine synthase
MKFISTRSQSNPLSISQAICQGLAPDGGLYIPESWPQIYTPERMHELAQLCFADFAAEILRPFFSEDPLSNSLPQICKKAFNFPMVLKDIDANTQFLELFHGPTHAFKDFGARFLALVMNEMPKTKQQLVLVATSGDTGSAVAAAFNQCTEIPVAVLYPKNMISPRQEKQLTCWEPMGKAFAVDGNFDDCQKIVKQAFMDTALKAKYEFISANSINLARLLPQMCYFAYQSLRSEKACGFIVPSGNLGNAVAALWAKRLGFPMTKVVCAQNANRSLVNYFSSHEWNPQPTLSTLANAMDVGNPSNFERLCGLYNEADLWASAAAYSVSDTEIQQTITKVKNNFGEIICPHTATAFSVREKLNDGLWIIVATAHPAKFETIVEPLIGESVQVPKNLSEILTQSTFTRCISADLKALEEALDIEY